MDPKCHLGHARLLEEDLKSETRAAVATGVTTWGMQLATTVVRKTLISAERAEDVPPWMNVFPILTELGDEHSMVDYYLTAKIMNDTQASEVAELTRENQKLRSWEIPWESILRVNCL